MKYESIDNWGEFRHDGLLFFAQRIHEMLFYYTDHIYKAPIYNTQLLVFEYLNAAELFEKGAKNEHHLISIMEEFQASILSDVVVLENIDEEKIKRLLHELNTSNKPHQKKIMEYIKYLLTDYNYWCKDYLMNIVPEETQKRKIDKALRCFIPGLISAGYSHSYIFHINKESFWGKPVSSLDSLNHFLNRFDFQQRHYNVYIAIDSKANDFEQILKFRLNADFGPFENMSELRFDKNRFTLVKIGLSALDQQSAAKKAYRQLDVFFRFYCFMRDQKSNWYYEKAIVIDDQEDAAVLNVVDLPRSYNEIFDRVEMGIFSESVITNLINNAVDVLPTVNKAIVAHNTAINDRSIRNRFLNLWSVLEILFITDQSTSKIGEIKDKIIPILSNDYIIAQFNVLAKDINDNIDLITALKDLDCVDCIPEEITGFWLAKFLTEPDSDEILTNIKVVFNNYPLIRSRISQLVEKCKSKREFLNDIERFSKRISWHLSRLYRGRNALIHSGQEQYNIVELVEHLHSYVDECMFEIIMQLTSKRNLQTIDNVLLDTTLILEEKKKALNSRDQMTSSDVITLFMH